MYNDSFISPPMSLSNMRKCIKTSYCDYINVTLKEQQTYLCVISGLNNHHFCLLLFLNVTDPTHINGHTLFHLFNKQFIIIIIIILLLFQKTVMSFDFGEGWERYLFLLYYISKA